MSSPRSPTSCASTFTAPMDGGFAEAFNVAHAHARNLKAAGRGPGGESKRPDFTIPHFALHIL